MTKKTAYLFPGQGAQYAGIGGDLHEKFAVVRDTYAEAGEALGYDIAELCFRGDAAEINRTRHTQPALLTHSVACMRAFAEARPDMSPALAAGHSLGEYTALVAAESLDFSAALKLVKTRGELMGEYGRGEMEALMLDAGAARELAAMHCCAISACNLPQQTVVGGRAEDLDALLADMAARHPRKRSVRLKTEGAFHTFYMVEAAVKFRETLAAAKFAPPKCAVLSNFSGDFHDAEPAAIRSRLFLQLFNPVLWHDNLLRIKEAGAELLVEFGGGIGGGESPAEKRPNLEAMAKKVCGGAEYLPVINARTLEAASGETG
ncbi:MAG: ACP S-malonyltransferase [Gammaproteobacteria bacterium]|nr:ACP S-malonyltransferase [Gammaproteobacteria bacterium]